MKIQAAPFAWGNYYSRKSWGWGQTRLQQGGKSPMKNVTPILKDLANRKIKKGREVGKG